MKKQIRKLFDIEIDFTTLAIATISTGVLSAIVAYAILERNKGSHVYEIARVAGGIVLKVKNGDDIMIPLD